MKNAIVDPTVHLHTQVVSAHGQQYGENVHYVPVVAEELRQLIVEYPCCLLKNNQTGQFGLHALLGFTPGENLFLSGEQWRANAIPMHIQRQPFMVGRVGERNEMTNQQKTLLTIDMNSNRVKDSSYNKGDGKRLFDDKGTPTDYLKTMNQLVTTLAQGIIRTESFIKALVEHDLIEAIQVGVTFTGGEKHKFDGLYVINEANLSSLDEAILVEFHRNGYLQACHLLSASMSNLQKLIVLKNEQLSAN